MDLGAAGLVLHASRAGLSRPAGEWRLECAGCEVQLLGGAPFLERGQARVVLRAHGSGVPPKTVKESRGFAASDDHQAASVHDGGDDGAKHLDASRHDDDGGAEDYLHGPPQRVGGVAGGGGGSYDDQSDLHEATLHRFADHHHT